MQVHRDLQGAGVQAGTMMYRREILAGLVVGVEQGNRAGGAVLGWNWTETGPGKRSDMFIMQVDGPT